MDYREYIENICARAKEASKKTANFSTREKNAVLNAIAARLDDSIPFIIAENKKDIDEGKKSGMSSAMIDRLLLDEGRIRAMSRSVREIALFDDPVGRIENMKVRPSGIRVGQMRVPIGVVAVIYESRPNVTTDIAALCLKSGNAAILRGGKESIHSNLALYNIIKESLFGAGCPEGAVSFIEKTEREIVPIFLKMNSHIDIVIPRGGEGLIKMVVQESTIPVIRHDKGICHTFVDESAGTEMAVNICINAKVQRPGVCNAMEALLIHEKFSGKEKLLAAILNAGVEIRGCDRTSALAPGKIKKASDADWDTEYLDLILSVKIVDSLEAAMEHIAMHSSSHSEAIVTSDYLNAERFLREVDSSAVFVNASTRFHDGGEFGLGAEVGISTQKLHARGAMGVEGLTTLKYIVYGKGETR